MCEYKVVFKNGKEMIISSAIMNSLCQQIEKNCSPLQFFKNAKNNHEILCLINASDISFIEIIKEIVK
jgi:hypothetical protein